MYVLTDGREINSTNPSDIVQEMADQKLYEPRSLETYRNATTRRARVFYGVELDPTTNETFVASLIHTGLLKPLVVEESV